MLQIQILCVGKLKEKFYLDASAEYLKRLSAYCMVTVDELPEARRSAKPSAAETEACLAREGEAIRAKLLKNARVVAMCVEGKQLSSPQLSQLLSDTASGGWSKISFIIGGSDGLDPSVKALADVRLSMSAMTFPHHLARVMLLEQIYRGFKIQEGSSYHK